MSVQALSWAFQQQVESSAKFVLVALANYTDDRGRCWPSIGTLVEMTGLSESTVHRHIRKLIKAGLVRKQPRAGTSNLWTLTGGVMVTPPGSHGDTPRGAVVTPDPSVEPSKDQERIAASGKQRPRDLIFDQLALLEGIDPLSIPRGKGGMIAKHKKTILEHTPDVTPQEIMRRAGNWTLLFPGRSTPTFTIGALAKWWTRLDQPERGRVPKPVPREVPPPPPEDTAEYVSMREWAAEQGIDTEGKTGAQIMREVNKARKERARATNQDAGGDEPGRAQSGD